MIKKSTGKHKTSEYVLTLSKIYFSFVHKEIQINYKNEDIPNGIFTEMLQGLICVKVPTSLFIL